MSVVRFGASGLTDAFVFSSLAASVANVTNGPTFTFMSLFKRQVVGAWNSWFELATSADVHIIAPQMDTASTLSLWSASDQTMTGVVAGDTTSTFLGAIARSGTNTVARGHLKNITTGATTVRGNSPTQANIAALAAAGHLWLGGDSLLAEPHNADVGIYAIWDVFLSDAQFDECWANKRTSDIWQCSAGPPIALFEMTSLTPVDIAGNCTVMTTSGVPTLNAVETLESWNFDNVGVPPFTIPALRVPPSIVGAGRGGFTPGLYGPGSDRVGDMR